VSLARDSREALAQIESQPFDLVLARLRRRESLDVLRAVKARSSEAEVIVFTGDDEDQEANEAAYALGAYQCLTPFDPESVAHVVAHALERRMLRAEVERLRRGLGADIGRSP
jgi:DNA-binding NtrC family response regulator